MKRLIGVWATILALFAGHAAAQTFPQKPVHLVVGFSAGGGIDGMARLLGQGMSQVLGQPVVVNNQPGAGGMVAASTVSRSPPDGYTVFVGSPGSISVAPSLIPNLNYSPQDDLAPVIQTVRIANVLVVHPNSPVKSVQDLIALSRQKPGMLTYASGGLGTSTHLAGELFNMMAGVKTVHLPYRGTSALLPDLLNQSVDFTFAEPSIMQHVKNGKLRAIGVTTETPSEAVPGVPTVASQGLPGFAAANWYGFFVPKNTPPEVMDILARAAAQAIKQPSLRERLLALGLEPTDSSSKEFAAFLAEDTLRWSKVIREANIKPQ